MSRLSLAFPLFVALRYLRSTRRDAFVTFLSATAAGGVALGVAALILSLAALSGFQDELRDEVLARTPHVEVLLPAEADPEAVLDQVRSTPGVAATQLLVRGRGWLLAFGRGRPVEIIGFSGVLPDQFPGATDRRSGFYVSDRLLDSWGLELGQVVEVVTPRPTLTPMGPQPRVRRILLDGTFAAGQAEQEERIALPLPAAVDLLGAGSRRILVTCEDLARALVVADELEARLPAGSSVNTWRDLNQALLFALRLEKSLMFIAVFLIVVPAAMALVSDLMLILASKQSEMGMLGAMGTRPDTLRQIFLWLGTLLVTLGAATGLALGIGGAWILDRYRLLELPKQVYFLDHVPFLVRFQDVAMILLATVALTIACVWVAASRAATLQPIEALRR